MSGAVQLCLIWLSAASSSIFLPIFLSNEWLDGASPGGKTNRAALLRVKSNEMLSHPSLLSAPLCDLVA